MNSQTTGASAADTATGYDALLEQAIEATYTAMLAAPTRDRLVAVNTAMNLLIGARSPEQIEKMDIDRGLRPNAPLSDTQSLNNALGGYLATTHSALDEVVP